MTTYRAACIDLIAFTSPAQCLLPEADLIEAAVAEAHKAGFIGTDGGWATEEKFRAALCVGDYTDSSITLKIEDVTVTEANAVHLWALLPNDLCFDIEVGQVVTIRTWPDADYKTIVVWPVGDRTAVTTHDRAAIVDHDNGVHWGIVDGRDFWVAGAEVMIDAITGMDDTDAAVAFRERIVATVASWDLAEA